MQDPSVVKLPAEVWERASKAYCAQELSEASHAKCASIAAFEYEGFLYAVVGNQYASQNIAYGWRLLPLNLYPGPVCNKLRYNDQYDRDCDDLAEPGPIRQRGDYSGLKVNVRGKALVLERPVNFHRTLPLAKPVQMDRAVSELKDQAFGWRAVMKAADHASWETLAGHPVYSLQRLDDEPLAYLVWELSGKLEHYWLPADWKQEFADYTPSSMAMFANQQNMTNEMQTSLF